MIIVDTSIAIKWLRADEDGHEEALILYKNHIEKINEIIVPELFYIEAANALATNKVLSKDDISEGMAFLYEAQFRKHQITHEAVVEAALLANQYRTSVYDMLYAVIAKSKDALLVTADKKFARATNFFHVTLLTK
ncbi:MAG: type II toxin-antitoxin system VapC family toxin [Candidatus Levyibacteriota bacterium]